ncbi:MAG: hypothetical protein WCI55_00960 [Armatimonadota bacterium]
MKVKQGSGIGENGRFSAESLGFNWKAIPAKMFGQDYFLMKKLYGPAITFK